MTGSSEVVVLYLMRSTNCSGRSDLVVIRSYCPVLVPENYAYLNTPSSNPSSPPALQAPSNSQPRPSFSNPAPRPPPNPTANPNSPAPLDWVHFEGRSVKTTLSNLVGLDGLAREKKWRSHCVFSVDIGRRARQGVEAVSTTSISQEIITPS